MIEDAEIDQIMERYERITIGTQFDTCAPVGAPVKG